MACDWLSSLSHEIDSTTTNNNNNNKRSNNNTNSQFAPITMIHENNQSNFGILFPYLLLFFLSINKQFQDIASLLHHTNNIFIRSAHQMNKLQYSRNYFDRCSISHLINLIDTKIVLPLCTIFLYIYILLLSILFDYLNLYLIYSLFVFLL